MKFRQFILLWILFSATVHAAEPACVRHSKPLHLIILVHGISADAGSFIFMGDMLRAQLNRLNPSEETCVAAYDYDYRSDATDLYALASGLGAFAKSQFAELQPQDRVSIVAHSQGGLISMIWMQHVFRGDPKYHPEFKSHLDTFVTLGTPFWGSSAATYGKFISDHSWLSEIADYFHTHFGDKEAADLSFDSHTLYREEKKLTDPSLSLIESDLSKAVRILNIAGLVPPLDSDLVVSPASARLDLIYCVDHSKEYSPGDTLPSSRFVETHYASNYVVVHAVHTGAVLKDLPQIVGIPYECIRNLQCGHPSVPYIVDFFLRKPLAVRPADVELENQNKGYLLSVNILIPEDWKLSGSDFRVAVRRVAQSEVTIAGVHPESTEQDITGSVTLEKDPYLNQFRFVTSGSVGSAPASAEFEITISAPGLVPRHAVVKVRQNFTTYFETALRPSKN